MIGSPSILPYLHQGPNGNDKAGSDVSSIAPSQSASQIGHSSPTGTLVVRADRGSYFAVSRMETVT